MNSPVLRFLQSADWYSPLVWFLSQTLVDHLTEYFGVTLVLFLILRIGVQIWWFVLQCQHQDFHWRIFMIRGSTSRQLNRCYSETPDVCLKVVACHLMWRQKNIKLKTLIILCVLQYSLASIFMDFAKMNIVDNDHAFYKICCFIYYMYLTNI